MQAAAPHSQTPPAARAGTDPQLLLDVRDLRTSFFTDDGEAAAVNGVSFQLRRGRILALVGESGCGKSITSYSLLRLIQQPGRVVGGSVTLYPHDADPIDVLRLRENDDRLYHVRGGIAAMVFQEPMSALSPVHTIGEQICEAVRLHRPRDRRRAAQIAADLLLKVGITNPDVRLRQYPHELSGGLRQRVVIAMALAGDPQLIIADEPTTALDVTIQAQVLALLKQIKDERGAGILLITHDMGVVAQTADDVAVMYLGRIVEQAPVRELFASPRHPYTAALLASLPSRSQPGRRLPSIPGSVPPLTQIPPGCPFHPRCPFAVEGVCDCGGAPELLPMTPTQHVACVRASELPSPPVAPAPVITAEAPR